MPFFIVQPYDRRRNKLGYVISLFQGHIVNAIAIAPRNAKDVMVDAVSVSNVQTLPQADGTIE